MGVLHPSSVGQGPGANRLHANIAISSNFYIMSLYLGVILE